MGFTIYLSLSEHIVVVFDIGSFIRTVIFRKVLVLVVLSSKVNKVGLLDVNYLILDSFVLSLTGSNVTKFVKLLLQILFPRVGFYQFHLGLDLVGLRGLYCAFAWRFEELYSELKWEIPFEKKLFIFGRWLEFEWAFRRLKLLVIWFLLLRLFFWTKL